MMKSSEQAEAQTTLALSPGEELSLQQLQQAKFWADRHAIENESAESKEGEPLTATSVLPQRWELTRGISLRKWQEECVQAWLGAGKRGVLKVVTGAGKTILALSAAETIQQSEQPELRVAIIVPTVVLLDQWHEELLSKSNLPASSIGLVGGGHSDSFSTGKRVLICVLNSAAKKLPVDVEKAGVSEQLLLVVDECHRAGSSEMKHVFETGRAYSLGLSATPERDNDVPESDEDEDRGRLSQEAREPVDFNDSVLGRELGPVVFEMSYADAIRQDVLPPFQIVHYGLSLLPKEREKYDRLSRSITDLRNSLETGSRRGLALIRWCRSKAAAQNPRAAQLLSFTSERKRLLYRSEERLNAVRRILSKAFATNPETKAILFHESIDEVMRLFQMLRANGTAVVAEHSEFPDSMRAESLRLFRKGTARVIVSARSLIEGFNVPSADLGIIVAASSSVRQRVQTLGRLLRRNQHTDGSAKSARLYVLYTAGTTDELIYEKADWEQFVGAERNEYFVWDSVESGQPRAASDPPRRPPLDESDVDPQSLTPGGPYPGDSDQGQMYSADTQGNIREESGPLLRPHEELQRLVRKFLVGGGRFRITPKQRYLTRLEKVGSGWQVTYLGSLSTPVEAVPDGNQAHADDNDYSPGDEYPLERATGTQFSVLQRDKRLIARKENGAVSFVVPSDRIEDKAKRHALQSIQRQLAIAYAQGHAISKLTVTDAGHVVYVFHNRAFFVGQAPEGAAGFQFE